MAEYDLRGSWTKKPKEASKSFSPMIGMIYEGKDKFFGKKVLGILVEMFDQNDEAVLRCRGGVLVSVDKKSLKIVA
jgi:hypothetical protein